MTRLDLSVKEGLWLQILCSTKTMVRLDLRLRQVGFRSLSILRTSG